MARLGWKQAPLGLPPGWGGPQRGAGHSPVGKRAGVSHKTRAPLAARFPVHVTMKLRSGLPSLRQRAELGVLLLQFHRGCERFGMRLGHFSVQSNHIHLILEGRCRRSISSGINGLAVRIARGLNRLWDRTGKVFADRYHDHILRTAREVRNALRYVLNNALKHRSWFDRKRPDPYSSGRWFDGWKRVARAKPLESPPGRGLRPTARTHTYLLNVAWRRLGLLLPGDAPAH